MTREEKQITSLCKSQGPRKSSILGDDGGRDDAVVMESYGSK